MSSKSILSSSHVSAQVLGRLARVAATAGGSDRLFMIVQYTLTLVLPSLEPASLLSAKNRSPHAHPTLKLYMSLKRLRDLCSDYRIFARLVGYPAIHSWGISTYEKPPASTRSVPRWIEDLQVLVNLAYQPLENLAYLSSHDIVPLQKSTETKLWLWSCRCWAAHVFLDLYRLHLVRQDYIKSKTIMDKSTEEKNALSFNWAREVIINLAYAPLTLHWSLEHGLPGLTERGVGAFGVVAAIGQLSKVWEAAR
ncbi:Putative uncharacterized protein [Taphrina deformans PYCC 5710]|uniref:Peroxin 11C n=1 Tax=Taphrina deformans (strain PYCC 5710 / ATCC 11124 / CBS 356.35 / IMI 108563 / JCM 9778 / NBRC 8474) TaxID=1097556 RepID=R4XCQ1_TAPDE|nr:Putative uncharacterized protein [Taphrina deformans PYCC 5710]|eukprot:CCG81085.1 Putative uncharacterized protein [Taphrina deformans PYCC 5710]